MSSVASSEPSASPSGFSWVVTTKRSCDRSAFATSVSSVVSFTGRKLVDQARGPHAVLDGRIVLEGQLRGPLEAQLPADPRLKDAVCGLKALERLVPLVLAAENAHVDDRLMKVRTRLDARHGDEPDP